jgi:hypothetical protein
LLSQRLFRRGGVLAPEDAVLAPGGRENPTPTKYTPTCLVVSHRRAVLERADQILLLERGQIADRGTLAELLARCEEMRRLYVQDPADA